jgi:hypothetical protein
MDTLKILYDGNFSDFNIGFEDDNEIISFHKCILAANSEYFKELFTHEPTIPSIILKKGYSKSIHMIKDFIYLQKKTFAFDNLVEFLIMLKSWKLNVETQKLLYISIIEKIKTLHTKYIINALDLFYFYKNLKEFWYTIYKNVDLHFECHDELHNLLTVVGEIITSIDKDLIIERWGDSFYEEILSVQEFEENSPNIEEPKEIEEDLKEEIKENQIIYQHFKRPEIFA